MKNLYVTVPYYLLVYSMHVQQVSDTAHVLCEKAESDITGKHLD